MKHIIDSGVIPPPRLLQELPQNTGDKGLNNQNKTRHAIAQHSLRLLLAPLGLLIFFGLSWGSLASESPDTAFELASQQLLKDINKKPLLPLQLDFQQFLILLREHPQHTEKQLLSMQQEADTLQPQNLCQRLIKQHVLAQLSLMSQRRALSEVLSADYQGSFSSFPSGQKWYSHWRASWLIDDVPIATLQQIAYSELNEAIALSQQLKTQSTKFQPKLREFDAAQQEQIIAAFRHRELQINKRLPYLFDFDTRLAPVSIAESDLPKSFPAPGIYDPDRQTFLYHLQGQSLSETHMDWLFLHEGVPGHHFQLVKLSEFALCPRPDASSMPLVSTEGWAAYIESIGEELGLFTSTSSHLYALKWRALRAIRVLVDIGIHTQGWSDTQAIATWQRYLPNEDIQIMQREIARVRRWPAQSLTYVYGKYMIEKALLENVNLGSKSESKAVRSLILRLSNYPLSALSYLPELLMSSPKTTMEY
ncbi:DUF885 family protein [Bowmanella sp. Y26]|uniref:DUF885 family protein n=1 Tax=Bowmanella yangjiangensis TaxID=2811230 RepID=UPI001BDD793F|nr:DUF885 family protein [Bowmanella yangjiangensis]MBT1063732.1 DUF885 family protein [Bowmanella yangjiangensis]